MSGNEHEAAVIFPDGNKISQFVFKAFGACPGTMRRYKHISQKHLLLVMA